MGSLAGEIENPAQTYPIAIMVLVPTTIVIAVYPLLVALSLNDDRAVYEAGYFKVILVAGWPPSSKNYTYQDFIYYYLLLLFLILLVIMAPF